MHYKPKTAITSIAILLILSICIVYTVFKEQSRTSCGSRSDLAAINISKVPLPEIDLKIINSTTITNLTQLIYLNGVPRSTIAFAPLNSLIAISSKQGDQYPYSLHCPTNVWVWNIYAKDSQIALLEGDEVNDVMQFSPEGNFLLFPGAIYDVKSKSNLLRFGTAKFVSFPNGRFLSYLKSGEAIQHLWNPATQQEVIDYLNSKKQNAIAFSPDFQMFATLSSKGVISIWDTTTEKKIVDFDGSPEVTSRPLAVGAIRFTSNGEFLTSIYNDVLILWNIKRREKIGSWKRYSPSDYSFNPSGNMLGVEHTVWDIASNKSLFNLDKKTFEGFNVDGTFFLVTGYRDIGLEFIDVATGMRLKSPQIDGIIVDAKLSPDGKLLALIREDADGSNNRFEIWGVPNKTS